MILQISIAGFEWVLGLGIMVGLSLAFTVLIKKDFQVFFVFLFIFNGFVVWVGLLELWTLIVNMIMLVVILYMNNKQTTTGV